MVCSMTAFARHGGEGEWGRGVWELRSVNHRYLEIAPRLPEELRPLEGEVRERIGRHVDRGKIDCSLRFSASARTQLAFAIDTALVDRLVEAGEAIGERLIDAAPIDPMDVLRWPGVLESPAVDLDAVAGPVLELLDEALAGLVESRRREGAKLRELIETRCEDVRACTRQVKERLPAILTEAHERLRGRIEDSGLEVDRDRLEQELVLHAAKLDVAEELDRLEAHVAEVLRALSQGSPVGRRLDFLMQEMNREANTLGSKSAHVDTTGSSVDLKVLIEQMREQVQNIE